MFQSEGDHLAVSGREQAPTFERMHYTDETNGALKEIGNSE